MVRPRHHQDPIGPRRERRHQPDRLSKGGGQRVEILRGPDRPTHPVPEGHVLGEDPAPVGRLPPEGRPVDRRRDAPPHEGPFESPVPEDLRHLRDVPELVGQISGHRRRSELTPASRPPLEVPDERLTRDEEFVHLGEPRAHREPSVSDLSLHVGPPLRPHREVVIDHRRLPIQVEVPEVRVLVQDVQQLVHHVDESLEEALVRLVPLAIPVGVRNHEDAGRGHAGHRALPAGQDARMRLAW